MPNVRSDKVNRKALSKLAIRLLKLYQVPQGEAILPLIILRGFLSGDVKCKIINYNIFNKLLFHYIR